MSGHVKHKSDIELLCRFARGEKDACDEITLWIRKTVYYKIPDLQPDDAHDIIQQTLTNLWQYTTRQNFELKQTAHALTVRIALARCVDFFRQKRYFQQLSDSIPCSADTPEEKATCIFQIKKLYIAINSLKPLCRKLIILRFIEEKTYAELSVSENTKQGTLRVQLHNCLKALRSRLFMCDNINSCNE